MRSRGEESSDDAYGDEDAEKPLSKRRHRDDSGSDSGSDSSTASSDSENAAVGPQAGEVTSKKKRNNLLIFGAVVFGVLILALAVYAAYNSLARASNASQVPGESAESGGATSEASGSSGSSASNLAVETATTADGSGTEIGTALGADGSATTSSSRGALPGTSGQQHAVSSGGGGEGGPVSKTQWTATSTGTNSERGSTTSKTSGPASTVKPNSPPTSSSQSAAGPAKTSAATTSVPKASSTGSTPPSSGDITCKKGIGYNTASYTKGLKICWAFNWASAAGGSLENGVMYIPIMWGSKSLSGWSAAAASGVQGGAKYLMGFNEPDVAEQANLDPTAAARLWSTAMEPLKTSAKLISPSVSNGVATADGKPMGVPWMKEFLRQCAGCQIDAVALHWYDKATNIAYFQKYFTESYASLNKPIWITEFMGTGTAAEQTTFLKTVIPWLESQTFIHAYAAFGDFADNPIANFVDSSGTLNDLGNTYADTT